MRFANIINFIHSILVNKRRNRVLSVLLANEFSQASEILDIGAGSGEIASQIMSIRPDLKIDGIDIKIREDSSMPIELFNGESIKHSNNS
jgi:precorrin-6B methylase 2